MQSAQQSALAWPKAKTRGLASPQRQKSVRRKSQARSVLDGEFRDSNQPGGSMKVTELKTMVVEAEKPYIGGKYFLFLELSTDEGITGIGERIAGSSYSDHLGDLKSQVSLIEEFVGQFVIGENPLNIERIWDKMYGSRHDLRHPSLYATPVISAIDMALWDIAGKAANQPIYNLLGGQYHEKLRAYAYMPSAGLNEHPEKAGDVAAKLLEEGNSACKIDPFMPLHPIRDIPLWEIEKAAKIFESIRNTVGNQLEVGIGTHGQLTTYSAIRVANFLEPYHPFLFEEPVMPEDVTGYRRIKESVHCMISGGEHTFTLEGFRHLIENGRIDLVQPDIYRAGGPTNLKKVGAIAKANGCQLMCHGIGLATYHYMISNGPELSPRCEFVDIFDSADAPWLFTGEPRPAEGKLVLEDRPGFGYSLDERAFAPGAQVAPVW